MDKPVITKIDFAYNLESKGFYKLEIGFEWLPEFARHIKDAFTTLENLLDGSFPHCKKKAVGDISCNVVADIVDAGYEYLSKHGSPCTITYMCMKTDWEGTLKLRTSINIEFCFSEKHAAKIWEIYEHIISNYKTASWIPEKIGQIAYLRSKKGNLTPKSLLFGEDKSLLPITLKEKN